MTSLNLSATLRATQNTLNELNNELLAAKQLTLDIGLAPFRIAQLQTAINDNQHAWQQLNELATSLELTGADHKL